MRTTTKAHGLSLRSLTTTLVLALLAVLLLPAGATASTGDGGWFAQWSGVNVLNAVSFPDATHGWVVGGGVILATADGGVTWNRQNPGVAYGQFLDVAFSDATHGWAVGEAPTDNDDGDTLIIATTDGGATWSKQSPGSPGALQGVTVIDATRGWAVGSGGLILATKSGGLPPATAAPSITRLQPAAGKRGATVTVSGTGFGASQGGGSVKFGAKTCTKYVSWSATLIKCKVPTAAKYGSLKVTVTTAAGASNAMSFTVKR